MLLVAGWGFWLSIIGLLLTVIGFGITLKQLSKTKNASTAVQEEIERIRQSLAKYDAAQEIAKAGYALGATRRYLSNEAWQDVSDSYEDVRRGLIQFRSSGHIDDADIIVQIEEASDYIEKLCRRIELGLDKPPVAISASKTRMMIRKHDELISVITSHLQKEIV